MPNLNQNTYQTSYIEGEKSEGRGSRPRSRSANQGRSRAPKAYMRQPVQNKLSGNSWMPYNLEMMPEMERLDKEARII